MYTVNVVGLDDYVQGVIAAEMPSTWSAEALKAQAVAARTYAITTDVAGGFYNLYPDTRSQMYRGVGAETPATDAAVAATSGQIVTYKGAPAVTYFFASSGGYTENVEDAWPGATPDPWLRGVPDPYDGAGGDPYHHWTRQMSLAAATKDLGRLVKGRLVGIKVTKTRRVAADHVRQRDRDSRDDDRSPAASSRARSGCSARGRQFTDDLVIGGSDADGAAGDVHGDLAVIAQMKRAVRADGQRVADAARHHPPCRRRARG